MIIIHFNSEVFEILNDLRNELKKKFIFELDVEMEVLQMFHKRRLNVVGVDPSIKSIKLKNDGFPDLKLYNGSTDDDLVSKYKLPIV